MRQLHQVFELLPLDEHGTVCASELGIIGVNISGSERVGAEQFVAHYGPKVAKLPDASFQSQIAKQTATIHDAL